MQTVGAYDAASRGRRGWFRSDSGANSEIRAALPTVRALSRDLKRNNAYASKISDSLVRNVIGAGIVPGAVRGTKAKQRRAQQLMQEWAGSTSCDADGRSNLYGLQSLAFKTENDSGDALIIRQRVNDRGMTVPLKLRVLEGDFLDHLKNQDRPDGSKIVQGVEFNSRGVRTHYWIYQEHPSETGMNRFTSVRTPAEDVIHLYEVQRPGQVRGMPRGTAGMLRLKNVDEFDDALLELQKLAACFGAWVQTSDASKTVGDVLPDKIEPASIYKLAYGETVNFGTPPNPSGSADFVKRQLMAAAGAFGVTYQMATGDLSGVNFSSGKMGFIEAGRTINHLQRNMVIPVLCKQIEAWFVEAAALRGFDLSGVGFEWTPPRREMIDPPKEIPAILSAMQGKAMSFSDWARENNRDPEEWAREMANDLALFNALGIDFYTQPADKSTENEVKDNAEENE